MRGIGYTSEMDNEGRVTITESNGEQTNAITSSSPEELLEWLLDDFTEKPEKLFCCWDLPQFTAPLFRLMGEGACTQLAGEQSRTKLCKPFSVYYHNRTGYSGILGLNRGFKQREANFYSLNQYFPSDQTAPTDAAGVQALARDLIATLYAADIPVTRLTSPITAYLSCKAPPVPTEAELPAAAALASEYAVLCTNKIWRDCFKVGHWEEGSVWDFDLVNAYAFAASRLIDLKQAEFIYSREIPDAAYYGFCKGRVTINPDVHVHPIMYQFSDGSWGTPVGSWDTYLTLDEIRFITRWDIGHFEVEDGWFVLAHGGERPLSAIMERLYNDRRNTTNPLLAAFLKGVSVGLVGKLLETKDDGAHGPLYNAVWHAVITSYTRIRLAEYIYQNNAQEALIAVNTDGCAVDRELPINPHPSLGQMRLSGTYGLMSLSTGWILAANKHPGGINYDTLLNLMKKCPDDNEYTHIRYRRTTLAEAAQVGDMAAVGELGPRTITVNLPLIGESQTRVFDDFPMTGRDVLGSIYESRPIVVQD